jgi:acetoin:2,6-dichlorophenolindophenol oxidoreductase subunit beta
MMSTYLKSIQSGLFKIFEEFGNAYMLGEDIEDPYGGAFKVTAGLHEKYPDRVITTPISEAAIIGTGNGMALRGMKPILEIMFGDFLTLCADQLVNHASKFHKMYGKDMDVPLLIRTPMGGGRGYGPTHSQTLEKLFLGIPNIRIIAPSVYHNPGEILCDIVRKSNKPTLFIENKLLYAKELVIDNAEMDTELDGFPTAIVRNFDKHKSKPDITLVCYGGISRFLPDILMRMKEEEINLEVVIPSSVMPLPAKTILKYTKNTGKVIIIEEGTSGFNWGSEVASVIYEEQFQSLKSAIIRLSSDDAIIPTSSVKEDLMLISAEKIEKAIIQLL